MILEIKKDRGWNIALCTNRSDKRRLGKQHLQIITSEMHDNRVYCTGGCDYCPVESKCSETYGKVLYTILDTYFPHLKETYPEYFI